MSAAYSKIKKLYPDCKIYLEDSKRDFTTPCFFMRLISVRRQEKENLCYNDCTLYVTYIPSDGDEAIETIKARDAIDNAFWRGFYVKDRFIHMGTIGHQTIGEDSDIAEIALSFAYYDADESYDEYLAHDWQKERPGYDSKDDIKVPIAGNVYDEWELKNRK